MRSATHSGYALALLTLVCTIGYLDRDLMVLFLQPIKEDLALSDTQLGSLTGIAFGLFYATLGLPIARWADRGNRLTIAALAISIWGFTALLYPLVQGFAALLVLRILAGVSEAGCLPPTYSLLGDLFSGREIRIKAMAVFWLAGPLAALLSFGAGGRLSELYGWRGVFLGVGIPALLIAALLKITLPEPRESAPGRVVAHRDVGTRAVFVRLARHRSSRHLGAGIVLLFALGQGLSPWYAAFMMRSHHIRAAELGTWFAVIFGGGGALGTWLGGYLSQRCFSHDEPLQMRLCALMAVALFPCYLFFVLASGTQQSLAALVPLALASTFSLGPTFAILQRLVPGHMRATSLAIVMLVANVIGMGLAPQLIGILSDTLAPWSGVDSLRYAMAVFSLLTLWAAYHWWQVSETVKADLEDEHGQAEDGGRDRHLANRRSTGAP